MHVSCPKCKARLSVADDKLRPEGTKFKCPKCASVMLVRGTPERAEETPAETVAAGPPKKTGAAAPLRPENKRKQKRFSFHGEILLDNAILVKGIDLSEGGVYVYTGRSFVVGSEIEVAIPTEKGKLTVNAKVQHNQPGIGMGLMFVELDALQRARIRELMKSMDKTEAEKGTVLLVDDNASTRRINKSKLVLEGFHVLEAKDGTETFKALEAEVPDIIVLDLQLEGMDGIKVLSAIRENPAWKDITVLVLSAMSSKEIIDKAFAAGADKFLVKMVTPPAKLANALKVALKEKTGN